MSYRYSPQHSDGYERALQHIREAEQLSERLGGADEDVKAYFFELPPALLDDVLEEYGRRFGALAREYAEETLPRWRDGHVKMSGMVAARLFDLLPPRMTAKERFRLADNLWRNIGPQSSVAWRVGLDIDVESVASVVDQHFCDVAAHYKIPDALERRFTWLAAGSVQIEQELLNELQEHDRKLAVVGARTKMTVLVDHMRRDTAGHTTRLVETLKVGKHELKLCLDRTARGIAPMAPTDMESTGSYGFLWWIGAAAVLVGFFAC